MGLMDKDCGASPAPPFEQRLGRGFAEFVEKEDRRIHQDRSRHADLPAFGGGKRCTLFSNQSVTAAPDARGIRGGEDFSSCGRGSGGANVVRDACVEKNDVLRNEGDIAAQAVQFVIADVDTVDQNASG